MNFLAAGGLEMLTAVADGLPVGIWVGRAPAGEFVYANQMFNQITGFASQPPLPFDALGHRYGIHTMDGEPYPFEKMPFVRALTERTTVTVDDSVVHRADGGRVNIRAFAKPLFDDAGNVTHVVVAVTDITEEVAARRAKEESEQRLQRAQRMESIGKLAGGIAHDFNNLLATVKVLTSLLRLGESSPPRLESLEQIEQAVDSGMKLTRGLLDFARREAPLTQRVSLNGVVRAVARLVERTLPRRIEVVFELNAACDDVLGDPSRLEQMVMNLVMNARDAMPDGGRLTLRTWDAGPRVGLEVVDTGVGIDPAIRDRIFEPYFTTKTHGAVKGTGLGLATVHGIIEAHRGSIEVVPSPAPGTVMRVLLPVAPADTPKTPEPVVRDRRLQHGKGLVLLVEDEPALSRASSRVLSGLGYDVLCAGDGVQALSLFREHQREVVAVVLDMILPRMDGQQTFAALKDVDPDVPVIITSGSTLDDTRRALLDSGVRDYLPKPYDAEELSRSLAKVARQAPRQV